VLNDLTTDRVDPGVDDIVYPATIPFVLAHLACLGAIWSGVTTQAVLICLGLYVVRMVAVTAGYHRYFSHRSFRTSRLGQFVLAVMAQTSAQRGVVWWAAKHRAHHKYSDTPQDPHSPKHRGFFFAHVGWIFAPKTFVADYSKVPDLTQWPELMWLDRHKYVPPTVLGVLVWLVAGWPGLFVGFFASTVLLWHGSFAINSLAHVHGSQRYVTGDDSRNNWWLAVITMGEGWHNNHHHFQSSTRQGFYWWEVDITYYVLKLLALPRLVWDLQRPPRAVVQGERRLRRVVVEKVAHQLAWSFPIERISEQLRDAWANTPSLEQLKERARGARAQAEVLLAEVPQIPSLDELRQRAQEMFVQTPSIDDIVNRAREIMLDTLSARVFNESPAAGMLPA
jgi:stearoyl-CoA desaturase (delta-9 desaturase)